MAKDSAEETQERILVTSIPLFAQSGFDGVSMRMVAAATSLTTAALYYHFPDKEQLYLSLVEYAFNNRVNPLMEQASKLVEPWARLEYFIVQFTRMLAAETDFQRLMQWVTLDTDEQRSQTLTDKVYAPFFTLVSDLIERIEPSNELHFTTVSIISLLVFPFETCHARRLLPGYQSPCEQPELLAAHVIQLLRRGLQPS